MFDNIATAVIDQKITMLDQSLTIRRLDLIHPQISGNKFYKLKYNFIQASHQGYKKILTFGGAYSNHIAATAFAAHQFGFKSVGIIRGEELKNRERNPTLATAEQFGMQLHFVSRESYRNKNEAVYLDQLQQLFPDHYFIPEGGTNPLAIRGTQEILTEHDQTYDVICCAVGTGGTIAGLIQASRPHQHIWGFSALKGSFLTSDVQKLTTHQNWQITDQFCCGGYAKTTPELIQFILDFEAEYQIPLEQIYTGKMLYGINQLIQQQHFAQQSKILVIHSGGLQGRRLT